MGKAVSKGAEKATDAGMGNVSGQQEYYEEEYMDPEQDEESRPDSSHADTDDSPAPPFVNAGRDAYDDIRIANSMGSANISGDAQAGKAGAGTGTGAGTGAAAGRSGSAQQRPATQAIGKGKAQNAPSRELNEHVRHGTSVFPFAAYIWEPQKFSSRVPLHWHKEMELVRFSRGTFKISVDMNDLVVENEAFLLLPGNVMHTFELPPECEESAIVFDPRMLVMTHYDEVQSEIFDALLSSNIPIPPVITPEHPVFRRIDRLYRYCARHGATQNASHRLLIKAKLLEIIALYHEYGLLSRKESAQNTVQTKQDKLKDLLNYIDTHFAGPMTIKDASVRMGVTDQYFCRYFRRVTGMSFTEYLGDLRLRRAAKEIELTSRAISDIAFDNGFENAGYFFKSFKNKFGVTPLRYRKRHIEETMARSKDEEVSAQDLSPSLSSTDINHTSGDQGSDLNVTRSSKSVRMNSGRRSDHGTIDIRTGSGPASADVAASAAASHRSQASSEPSCAGGAADAVATAAAGTAGAASAADSARTGTAGAGSTFFDDSESENLSSGRKADKASSSAGKGPASDQKHSAAASGADDAADAAASAGHAAASGSSDEAVSTHDVYNSLQNKDNLKAALRNHSINHLDAQDNEDDLYEDDEDDTRNQAVTDQSRLKDNAASDDWDDEDDSDDEEEETYPERRENSIARRTTFALQECFDSGNFERPRTRVMSGQSRISSAYKNNTAHRSEEEEFWFDDNGNLLSRERGSDKSTVRGRTVRASRSSGSARTTRSSSKTATKTVKSSKTSRAASAAAEAIKNKPSRPTTPSEIRAKIEELERRRNDPFGL